MISFRYHLISIVAIFLAIALGIVMGAAFVQDPLLAQLQAQTEHLSERNETLSDEILVLQQELDRMQRFGEEAFARFGVGGLTGVPVVLLTQNGASTSEVDTVRAALRDAGASIEGTVTVRSSIVPADEEARQQLAEAIGASPTLAPGALTRAAAEAIGERLAEGGPGPGDTDVFEALTAGGFVELRGVQPEALPRVGGLGAVLVVVGGGEGVPAIPLDAVLLPAMRVFAERGRPVLAVESVESDFGLVAAVREDERLQAGVSTIDNVDTFPGRLAFLAAIDDLVAAGLVGHYGEDAPRILPPPRGPDGR